MGLLCLLWDQTGLEREGMKSGLMCLIVMGMKQNSQNVPSLHGVELNVLKDEMLESSALVNSFDFERVMLMIFFKCILLTLFHYILTQFRFLSGSS